MIDNDTTIHRRMNEVVEAIIGNLKTFNNEPKNTIPS